MVFPEPTPLCREVACPGHPLKDLTTIMGRSACDQHTDCNDLDPLTVGEHIRMTSHVGEKCMSFAQKEFCDDRSGRSTDPGFGQSTLPSHSDSSLSDFIGSALWSTILKFIHGTNGTKRHSICPASRVLITPCTSQNHNHLERASCTLYRA